MATKIRLKRIGKRDQPSYRIVVVDARRPRDTRVVDDLGHFNPFKEELEIDQEKALEWLRRGAQPTDTAKRLLKRAGVIAAFHGQ